MGALTAGLRRRIATSTKRRAVAMVGVGALAIAGCGGDAGGGEPAEVVAEGIGERLENGAAFTLNVDGDLEAIAARTGEEVPPELATMLEDGLVRGAFSPDGGFAMAMGPDDGFFEMKFVDEAMYMRLDLDAIASTFPQADMGSVDDLRGQLGMMGLPGDLQALATAALDGEWVGITGLTEEALQSFTESMGMGAGGDAEEQQEAIEEILRERGLMDGEQFTERYLTVEGEGPTYLLTVRARELVTTLTEVANEVESSLGPMGGAVDQEMPDVSEVPEELTGFSVTVQDGKATMVAADVATIAESAGEPVPDIEAGEMVITMALDDLGDQLDVPEGATTIAFETLMTSMMGALMGGGLAG